MTFCKQIIVLSFLIFICNTNSFPQKNTIDSLESIVIKNLNLYPVIISKRQILPEEVHQEMPQYSLSEYFFSEKKTLVMFSLTIYNKLDTISRIRLFFNEKRLIKATSHYQNGDFNKESVFYYLSEKIIGDKDIKIPYPPDYYRYMAKNVIKQTKRLLSLVD